MADVRLLEDLPMKKATNLRAWFAVVALALCALALSACSKDEENKNAAATTNRNSAAPNTNAAPNVNAAPNANTTPTANTNTSANANRAATTTGQQHTVLIDTTMGKIKIELLDKDARSEER